MAGSELVLIDGGEKARRRGPRGQDVSPEKIETFLITLGETCNVVMSARKAGFSSSWAYRLRKRDASFRAGWAEAVREGYAKLELVLLERAMNGTRKAIVARDGSTRIIREYSTPLAVALLKRHADAAAEAAYEHDEDELREVRERILEKLEQMRAQDEGVEVKGIDRVGVIMWGLRQARVRARMTPALAAIASPAGGRGF